MGVGGGEQGYSRQNENCDVFRQPFNFIDVFKLIEGRVLSVYLWYKGCQTIPKISLAARRSQCFNSPLQKFAITQDNPGYSFMCNSPLIILLAFRNLGYFHALSVNVEM